MKSEFSDQEDTGRSRELLYVALSDVFDLSLAEIPEAIRKCIVDEFFPASWDHLSPSQRRSWAMQVDHKHDPEYWRAADYWDAFFERKATLLEQVDFWEGVDTPTALDLAKKEDRLEELRSTLAEMAREERHPDGDGVVADEGMAGSEMGSPEWRTLNAKAAAEVLHSQKGGSRDKQRAIREIWLTGKYKTRDACAEAECEGLCMSFSTARKALRNTPDLKRG